MTMFSEMTATTRYLSGCPSTISFIFIGFLCSMGSSTLRPISCREEKDILIRYGWRFISDTQPYSSLNSACIVPFLRSIVFIRIMPFTTPTHFSVPYASLPNFPVGTVLYDRLYNDDLVSIKVQLMNMLNMDRLPNMPMGFPFHVVYDGCGGSYISRESYEFHEHFCLSDHRGRTQSITFSYTAPSKEKEELSWRITVPSRESSFHRNIPCTSRGSRYLPCRFD